MYLKNTHSLQNGIMQCNPIEPKVGMSCCTIMYTDRYPYTIIKVEKDKVWVQPNEYQTLDFYAEEYEIKPLTVDQWDLDQASTYTRRKDGRWVAEGQPMKNGQSIALDTHDMRIDPSF